MSWENPRPSILQRPLKHGTYNNRENQDEEWRKEQARIQSKREKFREIDERLRRGNGDVSPDDKHRLAEEDRRHSRETMEAKSLREKLEKDREREMVEQTAKRDESLRLSQLDARQRKREEERRVMQDNIALAEQRKHDAFEAKRREQELERKNLEILNSRPRNYR